MTTEIDLQAQIAALKQQLDEKDNEIFQLLNVISNLPGSIYWKNLEGVYLGRNNYSANRMRRDRYESNEPVDWVVGKTDYDIFPKETADEFRKNDLLVMQEGREVIREEPLHLPDGSEIFQLSTKRPLYNKDGQVAGVVGNTVDISYLKKIEKDLLIAKTKAEEAANLKLQFMRNMEHDIRTPFAGIIGVAHYLLKIETDIQKRELINDIIQCSTQLLEYCNSIVDFSRVEHGVEIVQTRQFELRALLEKLYQMENPPAKSKNIELLFMLDDKIPDFICADDYRIQRILINLVSNAIKFTDTGHVMLKVALENQTPEISSLIFYVEDTGPGITPEKLDILFSEKFARDTHWHHNRYKGLGLGLRVVKLFIEDLGGELKVQSQPDRGTTFIFSVPFSETNLKKT